MDYSTFKDLPVDEATKDLIADLTFTAATLAGDIVCKNDQNLELKHQLRMAQSQLAMAKRKIKKLRAEISSYSSTIAGYNADTVILDEFAFANKNAEPTAENTDPCEVATPANLADEPCKDAAEALMGVVKDILQGILPNAQISVQKVTKEEFIQAMQRPQATPTLEAETMTDEEIMAAVKEFDPNFIKAQETYITSNGAPPKTVNDFNAQNVAQA